VPAIAVLDDRPDPRDSVVSMIRAVLPKPWKCIVCPLLDNAALYADWLLENDVQVLLADQVLNEGAADTEKVVHYKGDEVTRAIRKAIPNLPIYIITAYKDDADLDRHTADVEAILNRKELARDIKTHVPRMLRAGRRHMEEQEHQLAELATLAAKAASGKVSNQEKRKLANLQALLATPSSREIDQPRAKVLERTEALLSEMEKLKTDIAKKRRHKSK
jgi:hypothetical protein